MTGSEVFLSGSSKPPRPRFLRGERHRRSLFMTQCVVASKGAALLCPGLTFAVGPVDETFAFQAIDGALVGDRFDRDRFPSHELDNRRERFRVQARYSVEKFHSVRVELLDQFRILQSCVLLNDLKRSVLVLADRGDAFQVSAPRRDHDIRIVDAKLRRIQRACGSAH